MELDSDDIIEDLDDSQKAICFEDKAQKAKRFELGISKTDEVTNCKVESKAIYSLISLTDDNKDLDNSQKAICLADKADKLISFKVGDDITQTDTLVKKEREENSNKIPFLAITAFMKV